MRSRDAVSGLRSTFSFATRTRPASAAASSSMIGSIPRHGTHQGAQTSSSTGSDEESTWSSKRASVVSTTVVAG